jgi:ATP/maltotriose-dependent transcriptional regulator MalT
MWARLGVVANTVAAAEVPDAHDWAEVYAELSDPARAEPLDTGQLERLATAAFLVGRDDESAAAWTRAHQSALSDGDLPRAARSGFWLAFSLLNNGELAQGGGWADRIRRLLDDADLDCVEQGYVTYCTAFRAIFAGDLAAARDGFVEAGGAAERFGDRQLGTLARVGEGRCLIYFGEMAAGVALLDEAMVSVTAEEVSPVAVGDVYCTVIEACQELFDLGRVQEWTAALSQWCDAQPELVMYRGQCLIHRAEIMQLRGAWTDAVEEVDRACRRLAEPVRRPTIGAAFYVRGDLHRLRGDFEAAEEAYEQANESGLDPQPGLAMLRLAQGRVDSAEAAIRRVLEAAEDPISRSRLLAAYVEIVLAAGGLVDARSAADELVQLATDLDAPYLRAQSDTVVGAVLLAEGDAGAAAAALRQARSAWGELDAPYEVARTRQLLGRACRELGDEDTSRMEIEAARRAFRDVGASADLASLERAAGSRVTSRTGPLSARELEVLALVATGLTNRVIGEELSISEKTVARHLSNIFTKLGLSSRSAATAYAYEQGVVGPSAT